MKMSISTREQLKDLIHSIHDFIRNSGAGYGMKAMKIFNLFYGLKLIEGQFSKIKLPLFCKFSELVKEVNKKNIEDSKIINIIQNILNELFKDKNLKTFVWYPIPIDIHQDTYIHIIKQIDKIPLNLNEVSDELYDVDLKGKVYEYFIGRDKSAISELGAYFTDRHIINFIMKKVDPELTKDGKVKTMIDPFGGSGGFTLTYIKYLNEQYENINWKTDLKNIYHYDMELDVIKLAGLEMFAITGEFPVITENGITGSMKRTNTFKDPFMKDGKRINFDYIFSNPPYGGDSNNKDSEEEKRLKIIEYLKNDMNELKKNEKKNIAIIKKRENQLDKLKEDSKNWKDEKDSKKVCYDTCSKERIQAWVNEFNKGLKKEEKINPNDKEACSLILFMDLLAEDGVCIGVLKEGVFFDGKYSKIRGHLLENFDVTHVISVPNDAFENTTTKTSIIIFKKKDETKKIIFSELVIETEEEDVFEEIDDEIQLVKNKGDVIEVYDKYLCTASIEELTAPTIIKSKSKGKEVEKERFDYSLDYKKYLKDETYCPEGYELKKLGDLCEVIDGYAFKTDEFKNKGIRLIQISNINDNRIIETQNDKFVDQNKKYDNYIPNKGDIIIGMTGNVNEKISFLFNDNKYYLNQRTCALTNFKNDSLKYYVYDYWINQKIGDKAQEDSNGSNQKNMSKNYLLNINIPIPKDLTKLKPQLDKVQKLHKQISDDTELIPQKEKEICELIKKMTSEGKKGVDYEEHKIDSKYFNIINGKRIVKENNITGDIPVYGGGDITFYTNKANLTGINCLISKYGNCEKGKCVRIIKGNIYLNDNGLTVKSNSELISNYYLSYYLLIINDQIFNCKRGSAQLGFDMDAFNNLIIKVPPPSTMKKYNLEKLFNEVDQIKERLETTKKEHEKEVNLLMKPFENKTQVKVQTKSEKLSDSDDEDLDDYSDDESSEEEKIPLKKTTKGIPQKQSKN